MKALRFLFVITLLIPGTFLLSSVALPDRGASPYFFVVASAERDEDEDSEDEHEDKDDDEEEYSKPEVQKSTPKTKTIKVLKEVIEYLPVTQTVIVTEEAYATDSDGDGLVDAVDPDPSLSQSEYFTDSDNDGVPNALDRYPHEDDFAYYEFETDDNNNGILDSYESI